MHGRGLTTLLFVFIAATASAQIPEKFENLQVFPKDLARPALVQRMREFSFALGVRCEHCHTEASPGVTNRYMSDALPAKRQARAMLRMVATINGTLLPQLPSHATPAVSVDCVTCHRGVSLPKTLQTTLFEVASEKGAAAAVERYRELRKAEMGSGRYNFGEWEINELARRLNESGRGDAAMTVLEMNGEFHPQSSSIDVLLGDLLRARGDRDAALKRYRAALTKAPDDERAKLRVQELERRP
jgi:tetratricopeptide (TPR) repeat protein